MPVTAEQLSDLRTVNAAVNKLPYIAMPGPGEPPEWWTDEPKPGWSWVCRMYSQMKADQLKALGWSPAALTEVFCWTEDIPPRAYHAVLAANTGDEKWVLDSRADDIYRWTSPPYDYLWDKEQEVGGTGFRDVSTTGLA